MSAISSRRFGQPSSAPRGPSTSSSGSHPSSSSSSSTSTRLPQTQSRIRPVNHRVQSAETAAEEDRGSRTSLDTMGGNSVETIMTQTTNKYPQRARPVRSFTSPMQFESEAVYFPASSTMRKSTLDDQTVAEEDHADEGSETEAGPEEFVVALHDFTSSNETCLSFEAGQVIKVFNRDESGWWDGELNGQRGWFPSNYVDEDGITSNADGQSNADYSSPRGSMDESENSHDHQQHPADPRSMKPPQHSSAAPSSSSGSQQTYTRGTSASSRTPTPTSHTAATHHSRHQERSNSTILDPIHHATSLLHNAVRANRVAHFQPSTACVISSVRSVLSATDCLTRESSVLKAHPVLAKERKQILAELSKLVTQARVASGPTVEPFKREWEMEEMLTVADSVLKNVRRFLEVAIECGVAVPNRRSSIYDDMYDETKFAPTRTTLYQSPLDRRDSDKTPTPESPRGSTYRTAYSSVAYPPSDLKTQQQRHQQDAFIDVRVSNGMPRQPSPAVAVAVDRHRSDSLQSDAQESSSCDHSQTGSGSGSGSGSGFGSGTSQSGSCDSLVGAEAVSASAEASSASVSLHSSAQALAPVLCSPANVLARVQQANDQLLSIIAAFIGHIHGHTRNSHASSYAFLIDMTRATVDGVRNLLVLVEAVHDDATLRSAFAQAMSILWETRESVYEATAALVTAARIITSSSIASASPSAPVFATEEEEKVKLLRTATAVLRTGGECVGAVKLCLNRADPGMKISIVDPSQQQSASVRAKEQQQREVEREQDQDQERLTEERLDQAQHELGSSGLKRGKHTLSLLGRKATSLSCLREQYEVEDDEEDGPAAATRFNTIEEDEEEVLQGTVRMKRERVPGGSISQRWNDSTNIGDTSDSSEPMSRDHSQTSEYTLHSDTTAETSARPSMDRSLGSIDDRLPHSAPVLGSFPRYDSSERGAAGVSPIPRNRSTSLAASSSSSPTRPTPPAEYIDPDVCFNSEGQLTGATLPVLVERMTPHDTTVEASFSTTFFLCFRLFTTPLELFAALESRYHMQAPHHVQMDADEFTKWTETQVAPVRLRIFNFFKMWLETHWNAATDYDVLEPLITFCRTSMTHSLNKPGQRLAELAIKRQSAGRAPRAAMQAQSAAMTTAPPTRTLQRMMSTDRLKLSVGASVDVNSMYSFSTGKGGNTTAPAPIVSKGLLATLKSSSKANVIDVDPLELARQLTIMESKIYCSILPEELLGQEFSKKAGVSNAVHIKTMSSLSTYITGWISECILNEEDARKRTQLVKYFIKLGDRCLGLNNFNTLMAIQCALNSSTISRLKKTWDGLPAKYRQMMDFQRQSTEHTRNFAGYRQTLRQTVAPALPFVGLFLTDLTFCHEGNAPTRPSPGDPHKKLLNFDKYVKMSRIIGDLQRFQVPYNLQEVPEIQAYLQAALDEVSSGRGAGSADDLYRRSLLLEPRSTNNSSHNDSGHFAGSAGMTTTRGLGSDGKLGLDIFNWK